MRLKRLELVVLGLTLAFACFIGGYFTGRSLNAVSIEPFASYQNEERQIPEPVTPSVQGAPDEPKTDSTEPPGAIGGQKQDAVGAPRDSDGRININLASRSELMDLPGIGSVLSERIVEYRRLNGPFSKIEDLRNVSGIGEKRYETIKDKITV